MWIISYIGAVLLLFAFWVVKAEAREGWSLEDENWYYMELDGHMITGWKKLNGVWYYMNSSGQMVTGRQDINGLRYYFNQGGAMAETDISNVISNALKPVGKTLYVWGGGWNEADNGSGETSLYIGVWPQWEQYFRDNKNNYSYKPGQTAWKKGNRDYRFLGLDCSGYIGWLMYNSIQYGNDSNGYVTTSTNIAGAIAGYGFGNASACTPGSTFYPGDIVSIKGHCFLCLGQCQDGSALITQHAKWRCTDERNCKWKWQFTGFKAGTDIYAAILSRVVGLLWKRRKARCKSFNIFIWNKVFLAESRGSI